METLIFASYTGMWLTLLLIATIYAFAGHNIERQGKNVYYAIKNIRFRDPVLYYCSRCLLLLCYASTFVFVYLIAHLKGGSIAISVIIAAISTVLMKFIWPVLCLLILTVFYLCEKLLELVFGKKHD